MSVTQAASILFFFFDIRETKHTHKKKNRGNRVMKINNNKKKKRIGVYRHECVRVDCVE